MPIFFSDCGVGGNDSFTKILLHGDGVDAGTVFTDSNVGGSAHTWTATAPAVTRTTQSKFGGSSIATDFGDIRTPNHADFTLGSSDFTIDFWMRGLGAVSSAGLCGQGTTTLNLSVDVVVQASGTLAFVFADAAGLHSVTTAPTVISAATWHHIAVVRSGSAINMYLDGVLEVGPITATGAIRSSTNDWCVCTNEASFNHGFQGYIDEFRLSVGIARWTANFTPPTLAYDV